MRRRKPHETLTSFMCYLSGPYLLMCLASCAAGYVCERKDLLVNGCCNVNAPSSRQYICKSCLANGCCDIYEYCVSCCLQPDKVTKPKLLKLPLSLYLQYHTCGVVALLHQLRFLRCKCIDDRDKRLSSTVCLKRNQHVYV